MSLTPTEIGAVLIALAILTFLLGKYHKASAVMILLGVLLVGVSGHLVGIAAKGVALLAQWGGTATAWAFGFAVPGVLVIVAAFLLFHDLRRKGSRRDFWIALALGVVLVTGASGIPALAGLPSAVRTTVSSTAGG